MVVCLPISPSGQLGDGWGRAHSVAVCDVDSQGEVSDWDEYLVEWDRLHDEGGEGQHHARIARFLMDHHVQRVIAGHMGGGMEHMLGKMGIEVVMGVGGDAKKTAAQYGRPGDMA